MGAPCAVEVSMIVQSAMSTLALTKWIKPLARYSIKFLFPWKRQWPIIVTDTLWLSSNLINGKSFPVTEMWLSRILIFILKFAWSCRNLQEQCSILVVVILMDKIWFGLLVRVASNSRQELSNKALLVSKVTIFDLDWMMILLQSWTFTSNNFIVPCAFQSPE